MTCTSCLQEPADLELIDRSTGLPLCKACYCGMDQTLDEYGNIYPEALFFTGNDNE